MRFAIVALYNLALLAGTAYLVGWQDWSPLWFLLTGLLLGGSTTPTPAVKRTAPVDLGG
jgi:hypothetical protein